MGVIDEGDQDLLDEDGLVFNLDSRTKTLSSSGDSSDESSDPDSILSVIQVQNKKKKTPDYISVNLPETVRSALNEAHAVDQPYRERFLDRMLDKIPRRFTE